MKLSDYIAHFLGERKTDCSFVFSGGELTCKILKVLIVSNFVLWSCAVAIAVENRYEWGATGFDPELTQDASSKRFVALIHDQESIEIRVDSKEIQNGISHIKLVSNQGVVIESRECWKAMRHVSAPVACVFKKVEIGNLSGNGKIEVMNKENSVVHQELIEFDALNKALGLGT